MDTEAMMVQSLGENFFRFDYDSNRILNVKTGKLMPRVRPGSIRVPDDLPPPSRNPIADEIRFEQDSGDLEIFPLDRIVKSVCLAHKVTHQELLGDGRTKRVAGARKMAFFMVRQHTSLSLPNIARKLNRECHSTVVNGLKSISQNMKTHAGTIAKIMALLKEE